MIHEGTNGVQSLDLLGRKVRGPGFKVWVEHMKKTCAKAEALDHGGPGVRERGAQLAQAVERLERTTEVLLEDKDDADRMLCNSHEYLNMAGHTTVAWRLLESEIAALQTPKGQFDEAFLRGKALTSKWFFTHELTKTKQQATMLKSKDNTNLRAEFEELM